MQLVQDGPDWLYAQWPVLDGSERHGSDRFATLVLREGVDQRAADIAVMAYALLQVPEWRLLMEWWDPAADREALAPVLHEIARQYEGVFKLAVIQVASGIGPGVLDALRGLGFNVVEFAPVGSELSENR
jgi:hypothetical protein